MSSPFFCMSYSAPTSSNSAGLLPFFTIASRASSRESLMCTRTMSAIQKLMSKHIVASRVGIDTEASARQATKRVSAQARSPSGFAA